MATVVCVLLLAPELLAPWLPAAAVVAVAAEVSAGWRADETCMMAVVSAAVRVSRLAATAAAVVEEFVDALWQYQHYHHHQQRYQDKV